MLFGRFRQVLLVRKEGVEPPRPRGHRILSPARLPVPPLPHGRTIVAQAAAPRSECVPQSIMGHAWRDLLNRLPLLFFVGASAKSRLRQE